MKTAAVMEKKISLTLSLLLMAALCSEASIILNYLYKPSRSATWTSARLYCQNYYVDLVTGQITGMGWLAGILLEIQSPQSWIGLHRDPKNASAWRWIDLKTGQGFTTADVSDSRFWTRGHQSGQCALVSDKSLWRSERCSEEHEFYCTVEGKIIYQTIKLNWYEASQYCKSEMGYLSTISGINSHIEKSGWVGLYREFGETWRWIGLESSDFTNWAEGEPVNADCASLNAITEQWESHVCSKHLNFTCFDDNLVLVKENKTWEDALSHCRNMGSPRSDLTLTDQYSLVSLESSEDYSYIRNKIYKAIIDEVWTGLRFLGGRWFWVDGEKLENFGQLPVCPAQDKHCGTLSKHGTGELITRDCSEKRNFICYRQPKLQDL